MTDRLSGQRCYRFGPFVLDAHKSLLWRGDVHVTLTPKTVEVLSVLVAEAGQVVTKDELLRRVWPSTVVEENSLAKCISVLRKALAEKRDQHDYIVTVPGQGYRFVANVERLVRCPETVVAEPVAPPVLVIAQSAAPEAARHERRRSWRRLALTAVPAVAAAVLVMVWLAGTLPRSGGAHPAARRLTSGLGLQHQPAWSPDGAHVAYADTRAGNSDIWVQAITESGPRQLTTSAEQEWQPAWSPDGRLIAFRSEENGGGLYVIGADGRGQRQITTFGYRPRWSPSGQYLLFSSSSLEVPTPDLYTVSIDGGAPRRFRPDVVGALRQRYAAWHPALDRVGVWGRGPDGPVFQTVAVAGGPPEVARFLPSVQERIEALKIRLTHFTWAPSGRFLYFEGRTATGSNVWRITIDPRTNDWIGGPEPLTSGAGVDGDVAISADGRSLAFSARTERTRLWALPFDPKSGTLTGDGEPVTMGSPGEYDAAAPPDGSRVAFRTERGGQQEVWERSIADGQERLLIASRDWVRTSPRWSPDGRRLAYVRRPNGPAADAVRASIGILAQESGRESLLAMPPDMNLVPDDWSADGKLLLLACGLRGTPGFGICVMSTARPDAPVTVVARDANRSLICPRFSPDQRWISFMAVERGQSSTSTLYVMPAQGGPWTKITDGLSYDDKPRWSPDGRAIYFLSDRGGFANVWGQRVDPVEGRQVGQPFKVTKFDSAERRLEPNLARVEIAVSRHRLFVPLTESESEVWTVSGLEP